MNTHQLSLERRRTLNIQADDENAELKLSSRDELQTALTMVEGIDPKYVDAPF